MRYAKNKIVLYAAVTFLALAGGGFFVADKFFNDGGQGGEPVSVFGDWWGINNESMSNELDKTSDVLGESSEGSASESGINAGELLQIYTDDVYDFSFNFPQNFSAIKMPEESGDLILVQGPGEKTFQVFVSPFDEPSSELTPDRIKSDLPDTEVINPQQIAIGGGGIPALIFNSKHQSLGDTREIWFVWPPDPLPHGNYLYQVSAYAGLDAFLGPILETWHF